MAVYKHFGISNEAVQFEWLSENQDPSVTSPYTSTQYKGLAFKTQEANLQEQAMYQAMVQEQARRASNRQMKQVLAALEDKTLTSGEIQQVLQRIIKHLLDK